jgi:hypothetical protein
MGVRQKHGPARGSQAAVYKNPAVRAFYFYFAFFAHNFGPPAVSIDNSQLYQADIIVQDFNAAGSKTISKKQANATVRDRRSSPFF